MALPPFTMLPSSPTQFLPTLRALLRHEVEFVLVGGAAAIIEGAPILTVDVDILVDPDPANLERLLAALTTLDARYRDPAGRIILPDVIKLANNRLNLLQTRFGWLDVLRSIGTGSTFADLLAFSHLRQVEDIRVKVLDLEKVIESKEQANRPKDIAMLPVLKRTLELRRKLEADTAAKAADS